MNPKVSICVPNLNTRPFLPERFETIFNQTFQDWELIVYDSYSDDGAWEYIQALAAKEPRMRISQGPREGAIKSWNPCLQQARGEYVYIATSDDTMTPDCLEKLVAALERNPACGLAHCCVTFIDQNSQPITQGMRWEEWPSVKYFREMMGVEHIRPRGHDTVLALALKTAYFSITELLIRRDLFSRVGLFEGRWGPFGDLEWQMRATLATNTVHVPEYLATWRIHPKQASQVEQYYQGVRDGVFVEMADVALRFSRDRGLPCPGGLPPRLRRFLWEECVSRRLGAATGRLDKVTVLWHALRRNPEFLGYFLKTRLRRRILRQADYRSREVRQELHRLGIPQPWVPQTQVRRGKDEDLSVPSADCFV
jgi:glycosyltransferase involved in cell wall biosynthesis